MQFPMLKLVAKFHNHKIFINVPSNTYTLRKCIVFMSDGNLYPAKMFANNQIFPSRPTFESILEHPAPFSPFYYFAGMLDYILAFGMRPTSKPTYKESLSELNVTAFRDTKKAYSSRIAHFHLLYVLNICYAVLRDTYKSLRLQLK